MLSLDCTVSRMAKRSNGARHFRRLNKRMLTTTSFLHIADDHVTSLKILIC